MFTKKNPNKPPCIRNLRCFKNTGCPQKIWDSETGEGCIAWVEIINPDEDNPVKRVIDKDCIDLLSFRHQRHQIAVTEGVAAATESFRNGMVEEQGGKTVPKINGDIITLYVATKDRIDKVEKQHIEFMNFIKKGVTNIVKQIGAQPVKEIEGGIIDDET